jgi:ABC-type sugar transport system substrate-binding protein
MKRRAFVALVGSAAVAWPLAARAQQTAEAYRIGFLTSAPDNPLFANSYPAFIAELRKLGFAEGQNLTTVTCSPKSTSKPVSLSCKGGMCNATAFWLASAFPRRDVFNRVFDRAG